MKMIVRGKDFVFAAIYIQILYCFFPIIRALPFALKLLFRVSPVILLFFAALLKRCFWQKYLLLNAFAVFISLVRSLVYANGIVESIPTNIANSVLYWSCLIEGAYAICFFDGTDARKLLRASLILVFISSITSTVGVLLFPRAIRSSVNFQVEEFAYYKYNIGAYSYVYAIVFVLLILIFLIKNPKARKGIAGKAFLTILIVEVVLNITLSQFMAAIVVASISLLVVFRTKNTKRLAIALVSLLLLLYVFITPIGYMLESLAEFAKNLGYHDLYERFNGLSRLLIIGNSYGDVGARMSLYQISISHFLQNPLLGLIGINKFQRASVYSTYQMLDIGVPSKINSVGQHSDIIDLLGGGGLLCFIPFFLTLSYFWRTLRNSTKNEMLNRFFFISMLQYLAYGLIDHSFSCVDVALVVFVLVPLLARLQSQNEENSSR